MSWNQALAMFPLVAESTLPSDLLSASALPLPEQALCAWALRQRNTTLAGQMAQQVLSRLGPPEGREGLSLWARMQLVLAEECLLHLRLDEADTWMRQAAEAFERADDHHGLCDVHWLRHHEAADRGWVEPQRHHLQQALQHAERVQDADRQCMVQSTMGRADLFRDQTLAFEAWDQKLPKRLDGLSDAVAAAVADFRGLQDGLSSELQPAVVWFLEAFERSLRTGQWRRAMAVASNLGYTYTHMSDYSRAIEWLQRGLGLARDAGWPGALAGALAQTGSAMRRMGQLDAARDVLLECQSLLAAHPSNRSAMLALKYLAEIELDLKEHEAALRSYNELAQRAAEVDSKDMHTDATLGQARALMHLGRLPQAREAALHARAVAKDQRERCTLVDVCQTLAEIESAEGAGPDSILVWLNEAMDEASALPGYRPTPTLLEMKARAHAARDNHQRAYELIQRASELRQQTITEESAKQAAVLHVQHQVERAKAEREHLRQLAQSEVERSEALQNLHDVLLQLADIGQEITAQLDADRVLAVLRGHVNQLLKTRSLAVYLLDEAGEHLVCAVGCGEAAPARTTISVDDPKDHLVRALRERTEMLLGAGTGQSLQRGHTMIAPLQVAERAVGVVRVRGDDANSYGEREQLIFRNLCAYTAVAMDNARAYEKLGELQRQVAAQEKMASIGQLAAGVAHEINNPIGFVSSNLNSLSREVGSLLALLQGYQAVPREGWDEALRQRIEALEGQMDLSLAVEDLPAMISESMEGLHRVKRIVQDLRNFSRIDASDWLDADLNAGIESTLNMLMHEIKYKAQVHTELGPLPPVHCLAAQVNQVLMNLLVNASHAIEHEGRIDIRSWQEQDQACISIRDNGCGMSPEVKARIFEPFFTTKPVGKGTGLGLSLSFSIIKKHQGSIDVESTPGQGTCFTLRLPIQGPSPAA
ncbi:MAG: ATP-binding protein [Inhella sp.]|uniref:ATP-binding protein n=1 Tax=Inhella sp. TaxID=1921806 RepID=UPI0022C09A9E|nr:ATP-binding protein [Inhella sp.]MCZ8235371.1 ATP-binding protein [Inhella sp.]